MRITAADNAASKLRLRNGDVAACVLQIPATKRTPEKFRIYGDEIAFDTGSFLTAPVIWRNKA